MLIQNPRYPVLKPFLRTMWGLVSEAIIKVKMFFGIILLVLIVVVIVLGIVYICWEKFCGWPQRTFRRNHSRSNHNSSSSSSSSSSLQHYSFNTWNNTYRSESSWRNDSSSLLPSTSASSGRSSTNKNNFCAKRSSSSSSSPIYEIPENIMRLIKQNIAPEVMKKPLSSSTYKDFFASLLYAEDYYIEKWSEFCLSNVTLKLHEAKSYDKLSKVKNLSEIGVRDDKPLVAFEIASIPEKRPFLLSRDFVLVRPSGKNVEPFQGIIYSVVRGTLVLVEFKKDFHSQHQPHLKYDVSFSFNRVCLKRCHKAIETVAKNSSLCNFLFPRPMTKMNSVMQSNGICGVKGAPPILIEGPPSTTSNKLSPTGRRIQDMVLEILDYSQKSRILVCASLNNTCDVLIRSLRLKIPGSVLFRANAAFRELGDVPDDILSSSSYKGECFTCPPLKDLNNFKVIISTFVSSFRLNHEGLSSGHFSHIFMVDDSLATEPETMDTLANFAGKETVIVVTGTERKFPGWVRSDLGRKYGLQKSYFQRLLEMEPYSNLHHACG